jgi:hypothetical protein
MPKDLPGWSPQLERSFKEVLYRCLEEMHSTKAALYLAGTDGSFVLATHYGFGRRDALANRHERESAIVQRARETRTRPFAINHPDQFPEFANALMDAGTARLLVAPLYADSVLAGFVDARDKGGRQPFADADLEIASRIAGDLLNLIRHSNLVPGIGPDPSTQAPRVAPTLPGSAPSPDHAAPAVDDTAMRQILRSLRESMVRTGEVDRIGVSVIAEGHATLVLFTGDQDGDRDPSAVIKHQIECLKPHSLQVPAAGIWAVNSQQVPGRRKTPRHCIIATTVPIQENGWALVVSVVADSATGAAAHTMGHLEQEIAAIVTNAEARRSRRLLVRRLLLPGFENMPELAEHAEAVSRIAWAVARDLDLSDEECETALLAGYLHDVGMRELPDAAMYRHPAPGTSEKAEYQKHPVMGQKLLADTGLGSVPTVIRHHHERFDGGGYPDRLSGQAIPLISRIVHAAEVFDILTSTGSYKMPVTRHSAMNIMRGEAGKQFDPRVVDALARVVDA